MRNVYLVLLVFAIALEACRTRKSEETNQLPNLPQETSNLSDEQLAKAYCGSCHQYPDPSLLDKTTWEKKVLPEMARRMGVIDDRFNLYGNMTPEEVNVVVQSNAFADEPMLSKSDWKRLTQYIISKAPKELDLSTPKIPVSIGLPNFGTVLPKFAPQSPTMTTMLKYDAQHKQLWLGQRGGRCFVLNSDFKVADSLHLGDTPSDVSFQPDGSVWALTMGVMDPSDIREGKLTRLSGPRWQERKVLTQKLPRPVQLSAANLSGDEKNEAVICGYGNYTGYLSWFLFPTRDREVPHILKENPGAIRSVVQDIDHDGDNDMLVLFAQGNEQLVLFTNEGNEHFTERQLLQFPPVYGSSYFEMADFNKDGHLDILYTNGDNADYSPILKPYHGVRIFLNDGHYNFKQAYFYPIYGVFKAMADDFDQDGDLDIATISYFPDEKNGAKESFVYLESEGGLTFKPKTFPQSDVGRWLVMEKGDFDQDGDTDIALGSFIHQRTIGGSNYRQRQWTSGIHLLILQNKKK